MQEFFQSQKMQLLPEDNCLLYDLQYMLVQDLHDVAIF